MVFRRQERPQGSAFGSWRRSSCQERQGARTRTPSTHWGEDVAARPFWRLTLPICKTAGAVKLPGQLGSTAHASGQDRNEFTGVKDMAFTIVPATCC
jgi:hypothetical protein